MKIASVTQAKNGLSALLQEIERGESVLITSRGRPIATLAPYDPEGLGDEALLAEMVARGVVRPRRKKLDVDRFLARERPKMPPGMTGNDLIGWVRGSRR
ncbi:MAG: type II toxin-antitoxin system prevent-host-death family antitoxin [Chloroflexi bacterium]|nr:type II toxin-antitoxin system prevent-host-death family antitoxin [Chloroflexota bacterium]MDE2701995.1 type II toxin-antitoxin system prevent-host-death family antitoxin [Chloroflexota bacterium]MDE2862831.1 type II toxin-antitoxin system prevent-host-death family antitoxin [Chloroflexota bacterium]MDE2936794.1 type II toxin-antitoxin system prevent-host-death family antitoxin [Chloroflexota bacterium]MXW28743.1 type II toxin-antitoxin system prevent-host-death family antitoxin [Chloroflex